MSQQDSEIPILDYHNFTFDKLEYFEPTKTPRGSYISNISYRVSNN